MLVYDITKERSFDNITKWIGNIEMVCILYIPNRHVFKYCTCLLQYHLFSYWF